MIDELIKARRVEVVKTQQKTRRKSLKSNSTNSNNTNKINKNKKENVQKSIGANKAKRNAKLAAKRGIASNDKPSPMEIERQVFRQQRRRTGGGERGGGGVGNVGSRTGNTTNGPPRRSTRIRNHPGRTDADMKVKARNMNNRRKDSNNNNNTRSKNDAIRAPSKKVVNAALKAMNTAGYTAPKGLKMVISFAPTNNDTTSNINKTTNNKNTTNNNQRKTNNNNRRTGGYQRGSR